MKRENQSSMSEFLLLGSDPSFCVFIHRVAFEEVSGHRVLMKSGLGNRGRSVKCLPMSSPSEKCTACRNMGQQDPEGPPRKRVAGQSPVVGGKAPETALS